MLNGVELREMRAKVYDDLKKLNNAAVRDERELTIAEQRSFDALYVQYEVYSCKIKRAETFDDFESDDSESIEDIDCSIPNDERMASLARRAKHITGNPNVEGFGYGRSGKGGKRNGSGSTASSPGTQKWAIRDSNESVYAIPKGISTRGAIDALCSNARDDEFAKLTFGDFVRAITGGPRNELDRRALSEGTDSAGGFVVPSILLPQVVDGLRSASRVFQAGATTLLFGTQSDTFTIARLATDPTASWHTENAVVADSSPTFEGVTFVPRTLIALVRVSRELAADSANISGMLTQAFAGALGSELDRVVLRGSGVAPAPKGISLTTGVNSFSMGVSGLALPNFDPFVQVQELIETDNVLEPTRVLSCTREMP